jgi:hypothetical protein
MYALFRHGRIPWVRTLADVATFILLAADQPLSSAELQFLMKWQGYQFQETSLDGALGRERRFAFAWGPASPGSPMGWKTSLKDPIGERERFEALSQPIALGTEEWLEALFQEAGAASVLPQQKAWPLEDLIARWADLSQEGLGERQRRLGYGDRTETEERDGS